MNDTLNLLQQDAQNIPMGLHCIILGACGLLGAIGHFLIKEVIPKNNKDLYTDLKSTWVSKLCLLLVCFGFIAFKCFGDATITYAEAMLGGYTAFSLANVIKSKNQTSDEENSDVVNKDDSRL